MTILITGAAGFVGSHLIDLLEQDSAQIVALLRPGTDPLVSGTRVIWHAVELQRGSGHRLHDRPRRADPAPARRPDGHGHPDQRELGP